MSFPIDLTGHKYERLTVIGPASRSPSGRTRWHCRCDCGGTAIAIGNNLRRGKHKSCGCIQEEPSPLRTTFHMRNRPEYWTWKSIKSRCYYPKNQDYHLYGGRGIAVCEAWRRDFFCFLLGHGATPGPGLQH